MAKRKIIKIDEAKCNGCGLCIPNCREGAIKIIDGKARLIGGCFMRRARRLSRALSPGSDYDGGARGCSVR